MRHVILGNGPAGVIAAETIRKHARRDEIVLVGSEPEPPYSRMALPYLMIGKIGEQGTYLRKDPGHFDKLNIHLRRARAKRVSPSNRSVTFDDGIELEFDRLLVATGSVPVRPPIPGIDLPGVHPCWTLEDARHIMALAKPGARVLQMGAGFIGCIIMEALAARGVQLSIVEMGDRMVPRMMGATAGGMIKRWVERKGVAVYCSARVETIVPGGVASPLEVRLSGGRRIPADLVISATGVKPNIDFLRGAGIECRTGVVTDARMMSHVPGIYAAGDVAEAYDAITDTRIVSAIQPNAADQATCAGLNMVGKVAQLPAVTYINVLDTMGLISCSFGQWHGLPGGSHVELADEPNFKLLRLEFHGDLMVGANAVGYTQHVGVLRGLVEGRVKLGEWKEKLLRDPMRVPEAYLACAQGQDSWLRKAA
ncbi:MAG TPA: FAD-dependent oxidoreductase [Anaeromyxobacteraceae bacterium]|nr:FAD-dependent oxidoreductase [Anaeromyxobacteraceae bacterium]